MKKILSITMVMVAIMIATASFSSCSKSDDNGEEYGLEVSLTISDKGKLTEEQCQILIVEALAMATTNNYKSNAEAQTATGMRAEAIAYSLESKAPELGEAVLSYTLKCFKVKTNTQVITYYVDFKEGKVNVYNNKN